MKVPASDAKSQNGLLLKMGENFAEIDLESVPA